MMIGCFVFYVLILCHLEFGDYRNLVVKESDNTPQVTRPGS